MCSLKWILSAVALAAVSSEGLPALGLLRAEALQVRAPQLVRAGGPRMAASVQAAKVTLLGFRPALPPLDPGQVPVQRLVASAPELPRALPDGSVALLDRGRSLLWAPEAADAMAWGALAATSHAPLGEVLVSVSAEGLGAVNATGFPAALPLTGAEGLRDVTAAAAVDGGQLIVARGEGEWVLLGPEEEPQTLGSAGSRVVSLCVTANDRALVYVTADGSVQRVAMDPEHALAAAPETLATGTAARAVAVDEKGELYVATATGVDVLDEQGEPVAQIALPAAPSGVGFGGPSRRTLFITAGDSVWSVQTASSGAAVRSGENQKAMETLVSAGGDRIHVGW